MYETLRLNLGVAVRPIGRWHACQLECQHRYCVELFPIVEMRKPGDVAPFYRAPLARKARIIATVVGHR